MFQRFGTSWQPNRYFGNQNLRLLCFSLFHYSDTKLNSFPLVHVARQLLLQGRLNSPPLPATGAPAKQPSHCCGKQTPAKLTCHISSEPPKARHPARPWLGGSPCPPGSHHWVPSDSPPGWASLQLPPQTRTAPPQIPHQPQQDVMGTLEYLKSKSKQKTPAAGLSPLCSTALRTDSALNSPV